jgi:hypothetical protein
MIAHHIRLLTSIAEPNGTSLGRHTGIDEGGTDKDRFVTARLSAAPRVFNSLGRPVFRYDHVRNVAAGADAGSN